MHLSSFEAFLKEVKQTREYLHHIKYVNDIVAYDEKRFDSKQIKNFIQTLKSHYNVFGSDKRVFDYKAIIISLYGILEKYVELWVKEYVKDISDYVPTYSEVEGKIREKHFELSFRLIEILLKHQRVKFEHISKETVVKKLHNCIENQENFELNSDAFLITSGNLRHSKIVELLEPLNISLNNCLRNCAKLNDVIQKELGTSNIGSIRPEVLYNKIDDLVVRRNEIAHGSLRIDNILGPSELVSYIDFLESYCQAIFDTFYIESIKLESQYHFQEVENVIDIFGSAILAFEVEDCEVIVGDMLIIKAANGNICKKPILEIQIEGGRYREVRFLTKTKIAVRVAPPIKKTQSFYIKKKIKQS